jgi:hypothetical protein
LEFEIQTRDDNYQDVLNKKTDYERSLGQLRENISRKILVNMREEINMRKKALACLLAVSIVLSVFISVPITASANASGNAVGLSSSNNSYISVPDSNSLDVTNALTFEAWIRPDGGGEWALVAGKQYNANDTNPWYAYRLYAGSTSADEKGFPRKIAFNISTDGTNEVGVYSNTVIPNNAWTHVAGVYDGTELKIYINGNLENTLSHTGTISVSDLPFYIGKAPWTNYNNYNGLIDEVRVWNIARTAEQIKYDKEHTLTGYELGLVGYWRFDESSGLTTVDASGNKNDGNLYNSAYFTVSEAPVVSPYNGEDNIEDNPIIISADGTYRIYGTGAATTNTIVVNTGVKANIVIDDINVNVSDTVNACAFDIQGTAQVNLILADGSANTLRSGGNKAGVQIANDAKLTIQAGTLGTGVINAFGGGDGAGIGGGSSSSPNGGGIIVINSGTINATGGSDGAGIGSGDCGNGCNITIYDGTVTATGTDDGAGIGAGGYG